MTILGDKSSRRRHLRKGKASQWESSDESEEEDVPVSKRGKEENEDEDEWDRIEKEREQDLAERDALNERIKKKDKEKTRKIMEKSDKKVLTILGNVIHVHVFYIRDLMRH